MQWLAGDVHRNRIKRTGFYLGDDEGSIFWAAERDVGDIAPWNLDFVDLPAGFIKHINSAAAVVGDIELSICGECHAIGSRRKRGIGEMFSRTRCPVAINLISQDPIAVCLGEEGVLTDGAERDTVGKGK